MTAGPSQTPARRKHFSDRLAPGRARLVLALGLSSLIGASPLHGQEPVRAHVMGDPLPGRDAPAFSLPYVTAAGPGPVEQPFTLRAELGRVVVLAFVPGLTDSAAVALVRTFSSGADSMFVGDVVRVVLAPVAMGRLGTVAREQGITVKLLGDSTESIRRLYGVERGSIAVYVVNALGKITWRDLNVNPFVKSTYNRIRDAVSKAVRGS